MEQDDSGNPAPSGRRPVDDRDPARRSTPHNKDWLSDPALYEVTKRHLDQIIAKAGNDGQPTTPSGTQG